PPGPATAGYALVAAKRPPAARRPRATGRADVLSAPLPQLRASQGGRVLLRWRAPGAAVRRRLPFGVGALSVRPPQHGRTPDRMVVSPPRVRPLAPRRAGHGDQPGAADLLASDYPRSPRAAAGREGPRLAGPAVSDRAFR